MPVEKSSVPLFVFVPDREPDLLTDSHVKLDILVDTQEPHSTSHHKIAFEYDEDTVNLVVDPTLSRSDIPATATSSQRAPIELPESSQRAPRELPESSQ